MRTNKARDASGRWQKGHCPNPNGRPRKEAGPKDSDILHFKNGLIKLTINDKERLVTRHEALVHMMFAKAMKGGSVLITRLLYELFEGGDQTMVNGWATLDLMRRDYKRLPNKKLLAAVELAMEIKRLEDLLTMGDPNRGRNRRRGRPQPRAGAPTPDATASATTWRAEARARRLAREQAEQAAAEKAASDAAASSSAGAPSQKVPTDVQPPAETRKD